jgi:hypothetical protein
MYQDLQVDHRYTCPKNCVRPGHLRPATNKQNCENLGGPSRNNTSGVRGVHWDSKRGKWRATMKHSGKKIHVGYFTDLAEAAAAVIAKRLELFTHNDADRQIECRVIG